MARHSPLQRPAADRSLRDIDAAARGQPRFGALLRQFRRERTSTGPDALVLYYAFGAQGRAVLEGRVIDQQVAKPFAVTDSRLANLRRTMRLVFNEERSNFSVTASIGEQRWQMLTDAEGYFRIEMHGIDALAPGWHPVRVNAGLTTARIPLLLMPPDNRHGVISDIDDTIMVTEVHRWSAMLANTFLKNPLQRDVVPGMAALFHRLAARNPVPAAAPVFYVSASPRQLHMPLQAVLDHHGFPPGVLITKRVTNDSTREPLHNQMKYKIKRIEEILIRIPHVTFTLLGDDGELDPEIFQELRNRHPQRIDHVWIRHVHPDPRRRPLEGQKNLAELLSAPLRRQPF